MLGDRAGGRVVIFHVWLPACALGIDTAVSTFRGKALDEHMKKFLGISTVISAQVSLTRTQPRGHS